jgi:Phosphotransferase enzyme family
VIAWSHPQRDLDLPAPLIEHAVAREHIAAGVSTAMLERLQMPDGRTLVAKHVTAELDWMMRATHDAGRAALLWVNGTMARCPTLIDPALVRIEDDGGEGWRLYMQEIRFHPRGIRFAHGDAQRVLEALAALHEEFWDEQVPGLCTLDDLLTLLALKTLQDHDTAFLRLVRAGWTTFAELAPADVADAVFALLDDPSPLVRDLERGGTTLLHSDVHFGNAVLEPDRLVLVDWTLAAQGPPGVDFAWFLDQSFQLFDVSHDELVAEFLRAERGRVTDRDVDVACLSQLLSAGWQCREWIDAPNREQQQANLDWFVARARRALKTDMSRCQTPAVEMPANGRPPGRPRPAGAAHRHVPVSNTGR